MITEKEQKKFSKRVNELMHKSNWKMLEKILKQTLTKIPNDPWLLTNLANCLYEQKKYKEALIFSKMALKISPTDPLVLYDYAPILKMNGHIDEAIRFWTKIENMNINRLAFGEFGEGIRWAKSIRNNVYFHLALAYRDKKNNKKFKQYLQKNISKREKGLFCIVRKNEAIKLFKKNFG
jgi:tetratricopeptide (TPR) repeat protein